MSANFYPTVKERYEGVEVFRGLVATTLYQGSLVAWDASNYYAIPMTTTAPIFLGVAIDSIPFAGLTELPGGTYCDLRVQTQGVAKFKTTSAETYVHKTKVAMGADVGTVTNVIAGKTIVGEVWQPDGSSISGSTVPYVRVSLFGSSPVGSIQTKRWLFADLAAVVAATDKEFPVMVAPFPLTVLAATVTPRAAITQSTLGGATYFSLTLRIGSTSLASLGTSQDYTALTETSMGTITNAAVAAGDLLTLFNDQAGVGVACGEMLLKIEYLPKI